MFSQRGGAKPRFPIIICAMPKLSFLANKRAIMVQCPDSIPPKYGTPLTKVRIRGPTMGKISQEILKDELKGKDFQQY